jgi:hypothetical protein
MYNTTLFIHGTPDPDHPGTHRVPVPGCDHYGIAEDSDPGGLCSGLCSDHDFGLGSGLLGFGLGSRRNDHRGEGSCQQTRMRDEKLHSKE